MANPEHEAILRQGVEVWNQWREDNPDVKPDLSNTKLDGQHLSYVDFTEVNLSNATLIATDLSEAQLIEADLSEADLSEAELYGANFISANLNRTNLFKAHLSEADFNGADLSDANLNSSIINITDLTGANLKGASLSDATFIIANLTEANLTNTDLDTTKFIATDLTGATLKGASCAYTIFVDIDFSATKGLDEVVHDAPSTLGVDSIFRSKGKIPEIFLRGCGVPETLITFLPSMMEEAIRFYSCFISYSHKDREFAKCLHDRLQGVGIRCWLDEYQLNVGDKLHSAIYEAIRIYDKVILCCSETALKSWWVEKEFENVIAKEKDYKEPLLIPVTLDDYLFDESAEEWFIGEIREKRKVQKFENWKDHDAFEQAFEKVVKALRTDGGKPPPPTSKLTRRK